VFTERQILFFRNYFLDFYFGQSLRVQEKFDYVLSVVKTMQNVPKKFLKHLEGSDGLYEIRIEVGSDIYRAFCCFDAGNLVVLFNAFHKRSQKTPRDELVEAVKLMNEYFLEKRKHG